MTPQRAARLAVGLLVAVVLVASGAYLLLYLYRWEWNRAIVSGLFFLAALVTASTAAVLAAVRRVGERLEAVEAEVATQAATRELIGRSSAAAARRRRFAWLEERSSTLSVFIPVLLGAGALLSGITYVLERLAGALAGPTVDRRSAELLAPDLPLGPLRPLARTAVRTGADRSRRDDPLLVADPKPPSAAGRGGRAATAIAAVVLLALVGSGIAVLRTASQSRPEPGTTQGATLVVLEVDQRRTPRPVEQVAEALWVACRGPLQRTTELISVRAIDGRTAELVVSQGMGPLRERRFVGCLQDATIDLVDARVVRTEQLASATG